jgi:hypothetical protein
MPVRSSAMDSYAYLLRKAKLTGEPSHLSNRAATRIFKALAASTIGKIEAPTLDFFGEPQNLNWRRNGDS